MLQKHNKTMADHPHLASPNISSHPEEDRVRQKVGDEIARVSKGWWLGADRTQEGTLEIGAV